jgi:hypothetical protein
MAEQYVVGIDPGLNGAISIFDVKREAITVYDIPTHTRTISGKERQRYDYAGVADIFRPYADNIVMVYVEEVWSTPADGHVGAFTFGVGYGMLLGILAALFLPVTPVRPAVWKKQLKVPADKGASLVRAKQLLPRLSSVLKLKGHDGRAESAMISLYGFNDLGYSITKAIDNASAS